MTHYIIEHKKRQEYLLLIVIFICISFGLGYALGFLHGAPREDGHKMISPLAASKPAQKVEPPTVQASTVKEPEKNDDDGKPVAAIKQEKPTHKTDLLIANKEIRPPPPPVKPTPTKKSLQKPVKTESKPTQKVEQSKVAQTKPIEVSQAQAKPKKTTITETGENPAQYLVQVGLFASKENASDFVDQLEESGLKTFYEGFTASSGDEKYNVRLGPYSDKETAQKNMSHFLESHSNTSAYILTKK
ncbi:MAG: SPOR domain-containing protein [Gammaproteobacteria bacterium]|nr:SPOR domain-containing protein [Gammaproteobacteria bacterium]